MRIMVGLKERLAQVYDQFWEWVLELPQLIVVIVLWLGVGTLLCAWTLALLFFMWQALRWVGNM